MARKIEVRVLASRAVQRHGGSAKVGADGMAGRPPADDRPQGGTEYALELGLAGEKERVPAILLLPAGVARAPAALLLHGYSSRKEQMSDGAGRALLAEGIASLAIDLPMHGERGDPVQAQAMRNPLELRRKWHEGLDECALALRHLASREDIDGERLAIVGYSLGAFVAVAVAARDESVKAIVLAAGGDLPARTPLSIVARKVADPVKAVRRLDGRPLLMVNGRRDETVRPDQAQRLFAAAGEPKELRWWDGGHVLPASVARDASVWLAERLSSSGRRGGKRKGSG